MTIDVGSPDSSSGTVDNLKAKLRSIYACNDTVDVALFTDPEEIYLMKVYRIFQTSIVELIP